MDKKEFEKRVISEARKILTQENRNREIKKESITTRDIKMLAEKCKNVTSSFNFDDEFLEEDIFSENKKFIPRNQTERFENLIEYSIASDDERNVLNEIVKEESVFNEMKADIESELHKIQEVSMLEEAVTDVIKKYLKRGVLTVAIMANLLSANLVSAEQLQNAGIDSDKVEVAAEKAGVDSKGTPDVFNFGIVRGMAINDTISKEDISTLKASFDISDYKSSEDFKLVSVPYKLETSKPLSTGWGTRLAATYDSYKTNEIKGVADNKNYVTVASENKEPITYRVSEYPMKIKHNGETLKFLGAYVIKSDTRNQNAFFDAKGVNFAKLTSGQKEFVPAEGKSTITFKGNSISIALVYGEGLGDKQGGTDKSKEVLDELSVKKHDLFKYNRTQVETESKSYKEILEKVKEFIEKNPEAKFSISAHGSASQVPTSYNSTKPNNNLQDNFKSIPGEAKIENNKMLAKDRAQALLKQVLLDLKAQNPDILSKIKNVDASSSIGDVKYQNDPQNAERYYPDQYAELKLKAID